ncbi:putative ATP binding protein [Paratrimastix pyriformis]|uniref:ATP binding protein n=1 Tax=Paratrimastix pyriformis TaxID=342808 RepID=A0ABQ8UEF1_9EUKA|nr:putative ATP binding protein [Paratrimastix pyriformis]|eukprot:GAFH01004716.1.p1 GENE.GAFH01004716.1~~GAFH01004716.1.p1  ORF type:complete len:207 (-),score=15.02 GAFH01004716.1:125-721(-)
MADLGGDGGRDGDLERLRQKRLQEMKEKQSMAQRLLSEGHGQLREIQEQEFLNEVTHTEKCIVHFFHSDFARCRLLDDHLQRVAKKYVELKVLKMNVEKSPFFVAKLRVQVLPCLCYFKKGNNTGRLIGFDGLEGGDNFQTSALEEELERAGMIDDVKPDAAQLRDQLREHYEEKRSVHVGTGGGSAPEINDDDLDWS